jgi:hypothetical protein
MADKSGSGCLKSCAVGCATLFGLFVVLAAGAWFGRDTLKQTGWFKDISATFETAKSEAVELNALSARLHQKYPAGHIGAQMHVGNTNGVTTKTMIVNFVDPEFPLPESTPKAHEIAQEIAADYPNLAIYDQLRLSFVKRGSGDSSVVSTAEYQFPTAALVAKPADTP